MACRILTRHAARNVGRSDACAEDLWLISNSGLPLDIAAAEQQAMVG
jgi:hypothetical protein